MEAKPTIFARKNAKNSLTFDLNSMRVPRNLPLAIGEMVQEAQLHTRDSLGISGSG
jgi:hypothetical protein